MHFLKVAAAFIALAASLAAGSPIEIMGPETSPNPNLINRQSLPSAPDNCKGSSQCDSSSEAHTVAREAIDGYEDNVVYVGGTSFVASGFSLFHRGSQARNAILRCPNGAAGPGFFGSQIKAGLNLILGQCKTRCGT